MTGCFAGRLSKYEEKEKGGASPGFPVKLVGVAEVHSAFLNECRTAVVFSAAYRKSGSPGFPLGEAAGGANRYGTSAAGKCSAGVC
jgi:hypothetical protein